MASSDHMLLPAKLHKIPSVLHNNKPLVNRIQFWEVLETLFSANLDNIRKEGFLGSRSVVISTKSQSRSGWKQDSLAENIL